MSYTDDELEAFTAWEREAWRTRAAPYADGLTVLTRGAAGPLLDAAQVAAGRAVLDVATGPGVIASAALERGAEVVAVDQAEEMVALARAVGVDARQASAGHLPFSDGCFDAVVAGFLLNHLARPEAGVREMARVGRGWVACSVWDRPEANAALGLFGPVVQSMGMADVIPPGPDGHLFSDADRLSDLLAGNGLLDVRITPATWTITVDPGSWFDAVAAGTPRTGSVLALAAPAQRDALRARYVEVATARFGTEGGRVTLPAAAVIGSGRCPVS